MRRMALSLTIFAVAMVFSGCVTEQMAEGKTTTATSKVDEHTVVVTEEATGTTIETTVVETILATDATTQVSTSAQTTVCLTETTAISQTTKSTEKTQTTTRTSQAGTKEHIWVPTSKTTPTTTTKTHEAQVNTTMPPSKPTATEQTGVVSTIITTQATECGHSKVRKATCEQAAICVACGAEVGNPRGHRYSEEGICVRCRKKDPTYIEVVELEKIALSTERCELLVGESIAITPTLTPSNVTDRTLLWSSSDPSVVTVSGDGTVTGVATGEATVTVVGANGKAAVCNVMVRDVVLELPSTPIETRYSADYKKTVPIYLQINEVEWRYTKLGVLQISFQGWITYAADGEGNFTTPSFGWRVYDANDVFVAEGVCVSKEKKRVGGALEDMTAEIPHIAHGRYRLELYSTYRG